MNTSATPFRLFSSFILLAALAWPGSADAAPKGPAIGSPAPDFTLSDTEGKEVKLSDFKGKTVVLEWFNPDCPFVVYAHAKEGPLTSQPAQAMADGVVWLAINSGAPGKQGAGLEHNTAARKKYAMSYPVLLDPDGTVGRLYGAITTPHMFVIDKEGVLRYDGAFTSDFKKGTEATNYVVNALNQMSKDETVSPDKTKPWGCSVKYARK